jgi:hypothetical protein
MRQSRKLWEAGYKELGQTSTTDGSLRFCNAAEMHRSGWRFCRKVIKDA